MIKLIDIVVNLLQKHTHFEYSLLLPTLLLWGALLFLTHVFLGILSSLQTIIAEQFSINIITQLANKLTQVKNLNFFENKDHTIKLNTIHNGLHIRPLNYVSNLFFNLQRIIGLISLFGILFSISIYLPFIMIFATVPCILISNHIAKKHSASIDKLQDQKESMQNYLYSGLDNQKNKDNLLFNFMLNFHHKFIETKELYLNNFMKAAQKNLIFTIYADVLITTLNIALFFLMVFIILSKSIGVGAIAGYIQAFSSTQQQLQDLELNSYHRQMSAVFQDFSLYAGYSIDDNLFMRDDPTREQLKQKREMLKSFDENFQNCLNDYSNALFGTQYNGIDFSLGQKQRIAAIRAFLKPSHCVVLDEPSSAIDPIIEKEFLDFIFKQSQSKMALIITHRMGSVRQANEIIVLDKGKLVEQGNFETLIKKQGLFSELYLKQQY
ncbi:hypothetical protein HpVa146_08610 [Helicobacter pylori]